MDETSKRGDTETGSPLDVSDQKPGDENAPYDLATHTSDPSASGNPGANNPGVGSLTAGDAGVTLDTDVAHGFVNPENVGTGATSVLGAGGIGGTGAIGGGGAPGETGTTEGASGVTGTGTAGGTDGG